MDLPFLMLVLLLTGIGVIMVFSASYATAYLQEDKSPTFYFFRQALFAAAGLTVMYITSKINYQTFRWLSVFALGLAVLLLIAVLIPGIHTSRSDGVKRWMPYRASEPSSRRRSPRWPSSCTFPPGCPSGTRRSRAASPPAARSAVWWAFWTASAFWNSCPMDSSCS